jgi:CVNH domain
MQVFKIISAIGLVAFSLEAICISAVYAAPPLPGGSYTQTCRDIYSGGANTLYATCKTSNGDWRRTQLGRFQECASDISNQNGRLQCAYVMVPEGSYQASCKDIQVTGNDLIATCKKNNGNWMKTRLPNYPSCRIATIDNLDGLLACNRK